MFCHLLVQKGYADSVRIASVHILILFRIAFNCLSDLALVDDDVVEVLAVALPVALVVLVEDGTLGGVGGDSLDDSLL